VQFAKNDVCVALADRSGHFSRLPRDPAAGG
jgi:hypothetical protein